MNLKTIIGLCIAIIVVTAAYLGWAWSRRADIQSADGTAGGPVLPPAATADAPATLLAQPPLTDDSTIVRVSYRLGAKSELIFERGEEGDDGQPQWLMVEPLRCQATNWMVSNIIIAVKRLEVMSRVAAGSPGAPTLVQAGFEPQVRARFGVVADDGSEVNVEVGGSPGPGNQVYVRLPAQPTELCVVDDRNIANILERDVLMFREKNLTSFESEEAVEFEVIEDLQGLTRSFTIARRGADWEFVSPFEAPANAGKINDVLRGLNTLWVRQWLEQTPASLEEFGLDKPFLTLRVVAERARKQPHGTGDADGDSAEPQPPIVETVREQFGLLFSNKRPVDDDQQVYVMREGEQQVGTMNAQELQQLLPVMSEWRDMDISPVDVTQCSALRIVRPGATIEMQRRDGVWLMTAGGEMAEPAAVESVLSAVAGLTAVSFVEDPAEVTTGLDRPAAEVVLTFADGSDAHTLSIGDFTEFQHKRLRYVRLSGESAVSKVRSQDLEPIFQDRVFFLNREILSCEPARLVKIMLNRHLLGSGIEQFITLERDENKVWQMTSPTSAEVSLTVVNKLVDMLCGLRGLQVVEELNPLLLGLDNPAVRLTVTVTGIPTVKPSPGQGSSGGVQEVPGATVIRQIHFGKEGERIYAQALDRARFLEVPAELMDVLMAEFVDNRLWSFEPARVVALRSTADGQTVTFEKKHGRWQYPAEPDLPLDDAKIDKHVAQMQNLKTSRYVEYGASNLGVYGLATPAQRFYFLLEDGTARELLVSGQPFVGPGAQQFYASLSGSNRVFLLPPNMIKLGIIELERFEARE